MVSGVTGLIPVSLTELGLLVGIPLLLVISIVRWVRHKIGWQRFASGWLTLALILYSLFFRRMGAEIIPAKPMRRRQDWRQSLSK